MRARGVGSWRALEWGTYTDTPGTLVHDRAGRPIFTDTRVRQSGSDTKLRVVSLVDETTVRVRFPGVEGREMEMSTDSLRVASTPSFPRPMPAELRRKLEGGRP